VQVIVNDRVDIALAVGADGVHLGQDDLPAEAARRVLGENSIIGVSTHTLEEAKAAAHQPVNYIAFGPIFHTSTKANPDPVVGLDRLREVRANIPAHIPLVAIGGITAANARAVITAGADCVAVIGAVLADTDAIAERTQNFLACLV
jgi:thiamine-phosphate pyrophosphorylase